LFHGAGIECAPTAIAYVCIVGAKRHHTVRTTADRVIVVAICNTMRWSFCAQLSRMKKAPEDRGFFESGEADNQ